MDRSNELRNKRQAVGFIEAEGLPAAIAAADAAVKSANVYLVSRENSRGGGYMTIKVVGEVGAVKAAVEAAKAVSDKVHGTHSVLVIPRPATGVHEGMIWNCNEYTTGIEPPENPEPPTPPTPPVPPASPAPSAPEFTPEPEPEVQEAVEPVETFEPKVEETEEAVSTVVEEPEPEPEEVYKTEIEHDVESADNAEEAAPERPFRGEGESESLHDGIEGVAGDVQSVEAGDVNFADSEQKPRRRGRRSRSK